MRHFNGKSVCKGMAMGPVVVLEKKSNQQKPIKIQSPEEEVTRVKQAMDTTARQLKEIYDRAAIVAGETSAKIFESHQMMLEDSQYLDEICHIIYKEQVNAEYAVVKVGERFFRMFAEMDDDYMQVRADDMKDISERMIRNLRGQMEKELKLESSAIIVAEDLSPSETIQLDKENVLALVTIGGSANSHTAILARMMNIPALVGVPLDMEKLEDGMLAIVDGMQGRMVLEPDKTMCIEAEEKIQKEQEKRKLLQEMKGKENITQDGYKISICANVGSVEDVEAVLENDADGIGLFRSEFLYLGRNSLPTEEEQYQIYIKIAKKMAGKKVIIRTMDIGGDKQVDSLPLEKEENPALGCRGIRICLRQKDIFKTQLRALLRAAVYGNISIMYPMITSVEEVKQIYDIVKQVSEELKGQGISCYVPEQGIMIETPAAVMISDELAEIVDYFSIGTNDLTQYTLAIDRQNEQLGDFYQPHHKAILRMIEMVVENGHKCGKWVGICGELAADIVLTKQFIAMGVDELSVAPTRVLELRKIVRESVISVTNQ